MSTEHDETPSCKTHPDAPHGFDRNGSHSLDRYVCDCEGWTPPVSEDCYGMTAEERAEFEKAFQNKTTFLGRRESDDTYCYQEVHHVALGWAACTKLYRERLEDARRACGNAADALEQRNARIKELEAENERLRADATRQKRLNGDNNGR